MINMMTMITLKSFATPVQPLRFFSAFILLLLIITASEYAVAATIQTSVDRNPVSIDESFQIIFTANESPDDDPDFSPLEKDFVVLNQTSSTNSSWINGKSSKTIQWLVNVMAKQRGSLIIPAIKFGKDYSQTGTVLVADNGNKNVSTDEDLYIDVEATPLNPYIQSQVFYTLRLYTKVDISQAQLNEPELSDAVIERLGEDNHFNTQVKGVAYSVTERKYAIFPQKSGKLTIKPLVLNAEVITNTRPMMNPFFNSQMSKTKRVESKAITLDVKPVPTPFTGKHWLSAEQLVLKQEWSSDLSQLKVGEPVTRTLSLVAKGTTVGQLPELNNTLTNAQLKTYPDQPVLQEQKKVDGLLAFREEKIAIIPSKTGATKLQAIEIPWFNTKTQQVEIASIPETTLTAITGATELTEAPKSPATTTVEPTPAPAINTGNDNPARINTVPQTNIWLWIAVFLAVGWLTTLGYFLRKQTVNQPIIEPSELDLNLTASIKALKLACANNDANAAKDALLIWGQLKFNSTNLCAIASDCEARLRDEILLLNQTLYGKELHQWQGKKLYQTFTENKAREKVATSTTDKSLEPLYRL